MERKFVCDVPENDYKELLEIFEMKNTLESLIRQIAGDNDVIIKDSQLYTRLVEDYRKNKKDFDRVWMPYMEKYRNLLDANTELSMDFSTRKLFIIPKGSNCMETGNG